MRTPTADPGQVRVLLFARYAELLGVEEVRLGVEGLGTVAQVVERIRSLPGGAVLPAAPLTAVNRRQARPGDPVRAGDEVALLPPLSGG